MIFNTDTWSMLVAKLSHPNDKAMSKSDPNELALLTIGDKY